MGGALLGVSAPYDNASNDESAPEALRDDTTWWNPQAYVGSQ